MRFRKLRIAFSATCGIACMLLIVLWVRSYRLNGDWKSALGVMGWSSKGRIVMLPAPQLLARLGYPASSQDIDMNVTFEIEPFDSPLGFHVWWSTSSEWVLQVPHWFTVLLMGTIGAAPWLRWSFSLRTLLIATTLIAVVLGLIVWLSR